MAARVKKPVVKSGRRGAVIITGTITLTAAGAIASQDSECATAVKTATETGRYTLTLDRKYLKIRALGAPSLVGPADATFGNTDANQAQWRNLATAADQEFDIQLMNDVGADTDGASGYIIHWAVEAQEY